MRQDIFTKIQSLPISFVDRSEAGDLMSRLINDVSTVNQAFWQGQRQLISIARAVIVDPRILILDEATSSIDTRTEILVQQAIDKLLTSRTSFVIAHRLSTVTKTDRVLVIQQGQIAEQGTHTELLEQHGIYANLYAMSLS